MRKRALETREPSYMLRPARHFLIPEARGPLRAAVHMVVSEPPKQGDRVRGREARDGAGTLLSKEAGSGATGYMAAPESSRAGR
jgi:hypothetical protein